MSSSRANQFSTNKAKMADIEEIEEIEETRAPQADDIEEISVPRAPRETLIIQLEISSTSKMAMSDLIVNIIRYMYNRNTYSTRPATRYIEKIINGINGFIRNGWVSIRVNDSDAPVTDFAQMPRVLRVPSSKVKLTFTSSKADNDRYKQRIIDFLLPLAHHRVESDGALSWTLQTK
jgi:protein subunit release factor A